MNEVECKLRDAASEIETAVPFMDGNIPNLLREVKRGLMLGAGEIERLTAENAELKKQLAAREELICIGELVVLQDEIETVFAEWNEERYKLPAGTKLYARRTK